MAIKLEILFEKTPDETAKDQPQLILAPKISVAKGEIDCSRVSHKLQFNLKTILCTNKYFQHYELPEQIFVCIKQLPSDI